MKTTQTINLATAGLLVYGPDPDGCYLAVIDGAAYLLGHVNMDDGSEDEVLWDFQDIDSVPADMPRCTLRSLPADVRSCVLEMVEHLSK
jgi:hypothetical protein